MSICNVGVLPEKPKPERTASDVSIVIMGVSGSGKTTLGRALAETRGGQFLDADDFHSAINIEKMRRGEALTDDDREPWLQTLRALLHSGPRGIVLACSALRERYRTILGIDGERVRLVYLMAKREELQLRLASRQGHFAGPDLLDSQLSTLEEPLHGLRLLGSAPVATNVRLILEWLSD